MNSVIAEYIAYGITGSPWLTVVLFFLIMTQLTIFSVTLYLHRSQAHRAVDFHPIIAHFFRFWTWLTTAMVTREWIAIHRKHHAKCETHEDPHSPQILGINKVVFHGVVLYQEAKKDKALVAQYGTGAPDDWIERHLYAAHSPWGPTLLLFINFALFGAVGITLWALQMLWIPVMAAGVVNGLGHWWGYRNFETTDRSTNLTPIAVFIGGEELHNNHHAFPSSAKFALKPFEFDIGWAIIQGLVKFKLAKVLRVAPDLEIRDSIAAPDVETLRAVMAHRFQVMTTYFSQVILPVIQQEATVQNKSAQQLRGRLKRALVNDGQWLDNASRERLSTWLNAHPMVTQVVEYRRRLTAVLERSGHSTELMLQSLQKWCEDAENSGISTLQVFASRLRGYALVVRS